MKKTNRDFANDIEDALLDGLLDRVIYLYKQKFSKKIYMDEIHYVLRDEEQLPNEEEALKDELDVVNVLKLIAFSPEDIKNNFNKSDRLIISYAHELIQGLRNPNSHNNGKNLRQLDDDRIRRLADTAKRLLTAINGAKAKKAVEKIDEVLHHLSSRKLGDPEANFQSQFTNTEPELRIEPNKAIPDSPVPPPDIEQEATNVVDIEESHPSIDIEARDKPEHYQPKPIRSERSQRMNTDESKFPDMTQLAHEDNAVSERTRSGGQDQRNQLPNITFSPTIVNTPSINPSIQQDASPSVSQNVSQNVGVGSALAAEDFNKTAFAAGLVTGLFGVMGIAHLLNGRVLSGLVLLIVGTVCYWIFILLLASLLFSIADALLLLVLGIHLVVIYKSANSGAQKKKNTP